MAAFSPDQVTQLLRAWTAGDKQALDKIVPLVYGQLHQLAHRYMADERCGHTLQTTALINEAYLRLAGCDQMSWQNRTHFFAVSAQLMRRILIDFARSRGYQKRGADAAHLSLDDAPSVCQECNPDLIALDDALNALARLDERKSRVVELKFFGGLGINEIAEFLGISADTVTRDWKFAKMWLLRELTRAT